MLARAANGGVRCCGRSAHDPSQDPQDGRDLRENAPFLFAVCWHELAHEGGDSEYCACGPLCLRGIIGGHPCGDYSEYNGG